MENYNDERKVLIPMSEYNELIECKQALKDAKDELKKDCKERNLYVEIQVYWNEASGLFDRKINPRLNLMSKEEALATAQDELYRLGYVNKELKDEIDRLKNLKLFDRIFKKY